MYITERKEKGMETNKGTRRRYDKEFKQEAVRLVVEGKRKISDVARDLGIRANSLQRWKQEEERKHEEAFPGQGKLRGTEEEMRRLRLELEEVREERDILKKALAVFSRGGK